MATINPFQQYSQGENTVTNNVLLMLSNIYEISPKYYEEFIKGLIEDTDNYEVIPNFRQQVGNKGGGIIDGYIQTRATKIIIETKLHGLEWIDKLIKYGKSFQENELSLLVHLSSKKYSDNKMEEINQKLLELEGVGTINFFSLTYQDLVDQLKELSNTYLYEKQLQNLSENFETYCIHMRLMPHSNHILRAMACGQSYNLNIKHQFYFDLASRGYSDFNYLGIYKWKKVKYIGKVENMILADWDEINGLIIKESKYEVTQDQKNRLTTAIKESIEKGWNVAYEHRFFLLKDFIETDFRKVSPGGIFRVRYFNLETRLDEVPKEMKALAEALKQITWE